MWLATSGRSGRCLENPLQGDCLVQLEEGAPEGVSRPSVISQLDQREEPWVQTFETKTIPRESHPVRLSDPLRVIHLTTGTFLYLTEMR
ncbi:zinc finger protein 774 [Phyllostomus discolor]|uniref:Zinc finger protein 774 n=1 Tax=Phyllostomus discolor TaxID=89673 RepID=A0A834DHN3_9CHIR|nr:zinc finger protein 774 [Phyllostomus discolor]